jgi:hypothetical protein
MVQAIFTALHHCLVPVLPACSHHSKDQTLAMRDQRAQPRRPGAAPPQDEPAQFFDAPISADERREMIDALHQVKALIERIEQRLAATPGSDGQDVHPVVLWRRRRGLSQAELAQAVGLTAPAICRIENAPGLACRKDTREKLSEVLGVPAEWLVHRVS